MKILLIIWIINFTIGRLFATYINNDNEQQLRLLYNRYSILIIITALMGFINWILGAIIVVYGIIIIL